MPSAMLITVGNKIRAAVATPIMIILDLALSAFCPFPTAYSIPDHASPSAPPANPSRCMILPMFTVSDPKPSLESWELA
jgi:hypothetical protein